MFEPTIEHIREIFKSKGYPFSIDNLPYKLNIIGIRCEATDRLFKDLIIVAYVDVLGRLQTDYFTAILDPVDILQFGSKNKKDIIYLEEGHYSNSFKQVLENGLKLIPIKPLKYIKGIFSPFFEASSNPISGKPNFRIEGHVGQFGSEVIKIWSNGSHLIEKDYEIFIYLIRQACKNHGNIFSYTLLNERDFY